MKLSKKQEAELMKVYNTWWDSYLNGDVETYDSFLEDDFRFVGSTDSEEFLNRKDATAFFDDTAEQLAGKTKRENSVITLEPMKDMVLVTDLADAYVKSDSEWVYYARFRFTSMMRYTKNGWRFFYQHFSTPDLKAQEGETIGTEKISAENLELRSAIKRRTAELELKNRDLEIEASLERIRAKTTAMKQSSDLLDIVVTMRTEFVNLGHEAHYFWHMRWLPDRFQKAMTSGDGSRIGMVMELPRDFHSHYEGMTEWEENEEPVMVLALETEIAVDYIDKMIRQGDFQQVDPNAPTLDDIRHIKGITFVMARTSHGEIGYSLPGVVKNPPKEDLDILVRFAGAFDLAHRRFLDLQKAENQAREVEIELALEKVRSRSIGMRKSEELREVIQVIHDQLIDLNFEIDAAGFTLDYHQNNDWNTWIANKSGSLPSLMYFPYIDHPQFNYYKNAKEKGLDFLANTLSFEDKNSIFEYMFKFMGDFPQAEKDELLSKPGLAISQAFLKNISLWIYNLDAIPYSDKDNNTLMRFAKVFEQAYIRFNDLKKAEAQAREAQIEAALERVRARTMAMQQSEELAEVATVLFQQVKELGIPQWTCGFNIWKIGDKEFTFYPGGPEGEILPSCQVPLFDHPIFAQFDESRRRGDELLVYEKKGELGADHYRYMHSLPGIGDMLQGMLDMGLEFPEYQIDHIANFAYGNLIFITYEPFPEMHNVFVRFAKVFEQTYTRFLDLKKAEAQAREAKIEGALERVRSRTVGMQQSQELGDVATVLFKELNELVDNLWTCGFVLCEKDRKEDEWWLSTEQGFIPAFYLPNVGDDTHHNIYNGWKKGKSYHTEQLEGEALQEHYDWLMTFPVAKKIFDEMEADGLEKPAWQKLHCAYFSYGYLVMITRVPCPEEEIFKRFAKVFDQTYRRFLDLQKAEAQAREAEIELALERVRARTMAMQKSEELKEVIQVVYEQFVGLNIHIEHTGFILDYKANDDMHIWLADRHEIQSEITFPYFDCDYWNSFNEAKEKGLDFFITHLTFEEKNKFYEDLFKLISDVPEESIKSYLSYDGLAASTVLMDNVGLYIENFSGIPYTDEENAILMRFGKVFQQTYTRFLDLQKAEEQARESQIEAALEKIRSRTMAMQKGEELKDVVVLLYKELMGLGVTNFVTCGYVEVNEEIERQITWVTGPGGDSLGLFYLPLTGDATFDERFAAWQRQQAVFHQKVGGEVRRKHLEYAITTFNSKEAEEMVLTQFPDPTVFYCFNFSHGYLHLVTGSELTKEEEILIARFTKVFEQTYARFLDLQKAETQAREAQIEAALERTRNRSMQMQHSDEIKDLSKIFHEQLHVLNIPTEFSYVWLPEEDKQEHMFWATWSETTKGSTSTLSKSVVYPLDKTEPYTAACYKAWESEEPVHESKILPEETENFFDTWKELLKGAKKLKVRYFPEGIYYAEAYMKYGCFGINIRRALQKDEADILHRFAIEFERAYTRFLDLQKAEAQTRESQIEAALERVRSKTMAMHNSSDVKETVKTFFDEVLKLGIDKSIRCGIGILEGHEGMETWSANATDEGEVEMRVGMLNMTIHPMLRGLKKAWKNGEKGYSYYYTEKDVFKYYKALNNEPEYPFNADLNNLPKREYHKSFFFSSGIIFAFSENPMTEESSAVLQRFAEVFGQTYRRFLDLRKAEAQSREAQIELALERVRNRAMAMRKSNELGELIITVFKELQGLDMELTRCLLWIFNKEDESASAWMTNSEDPDHAANYDVPYHDHPAYKNYLKGWKAQLPEWEYQLKGKNKDRWDEILVEGFFKSLPRKVKNAMKAPQCVILSGSFNKYGLIQTAGLEPLSQENKGILKRFSQVFEQNYNRFLDLKKAEKQAREAQIEAALEKVRSRTMAMQSSTELVEAANLLFNQVRELGINAWSAGYNVLSDDKTQSKCWMSSEDQLQDPFPLYYTEEASFIEMGKFLKSKADFFVQELAGKDLIQHYDYMKSLPELQETFKNLQEAGLSLPTYQINHLCKFSRGYLLFITYEKVPEAHDIFKRFARVFEQTYTRFMDLQKAEKQSKEAQIELALERVRASTMAMHRSEQLAETAEVLFEQFDLLGVTPDRISVAIFNEKKRIFELWATDQKGSNVDYVHDFSIDEPTCMAKTYKAWKEKKESFVVDLRGKELKDWIRFVKEDAKMELDSSKFRGRRVQHCAFFSQGYLLLSSHLPIADEMMQILLRFAKVFQQTYTRFLDLQRAEEQAREAVKHASVDRVRAEIASMRTTTDLKRITPLVWNELTTLDVPFIRCGVFIMDEELQQVQTHLSTPDGKAIASFNLPFDDTRPLDQLLPYWRKKKMYTDYWDEAAFLESTKILMQRGAIASSETYVTENQPTSLHLHFFPFLQGMLYVGSEVSLTEDELNLAQNLAEAFSSAYARYEDFNKLELANKKIEKTLEDLKQTQTQLIQSEKMASLGELTAGIAHEIQNPLNFVNNFSEVSRELMKEMQEEIERGDFPEALDIGNDIEQNLEKINHHGKRASDIVKGMLQHSRSNSGEREPTDLNALTDEYLRLAYHGLRAKDKSFNVKMDTEFEDDLEKVSVVPQDMGRVILNLITNAFYVVNEKKNSGIENYEPTVYIGTKKNKNTVEIVVKDNGNGIPKNVLDKIFQPFFTTKPTGKGTGLGLSLSYDIVKAHGGEIKVETTKNKGTEFIITLPVN